MWLSVETKVLTVSESLMVSLTCGFGIGCHGNRLPTVVYRGTSLKFIWTNRRPSQPFRRLIESRMVPWDAVQPTSLPLPNTTLRDAPCCVMWKNVTKIQTMHPYEPYSIVMKNRKIFQFSQQWETICNCNNYFISLLSLLILTAWFLFLPYSKSLLITLYCCCY